MSDQQKAQVLLSECSKRFGMESQEPITDLQITLDNGLSLFVDHLEPVAKLMFTVPITEMNGTDTVATYLELLELNLYGEELAGGQFALAQPSNEIVLIKQVDIPSQDPATFCDSFTEFIETATVWYEAFHGAYADRHVPISHQDKGVVKV